MKKKLFAGLVSLLLTMGVVHADVIYNEEYDGDIGFGTTITLDIGDKTVVGETSVVYTKELHFWDFDILSFNVLPGQKVTSVFYTVLDLQYNDIDGEDENFAEQGFYLYDVTNSTNLSSTYVFYDLLSPDLQYPQSVELFSGLTPLGEGCYRYFQGASIDIGDSWINNYQITFEVVPVPGAVLLCMIGLGVAKVKLRKFA